VQGGETGSRQIGSVQPDNLLKKQELLGTLLIGRLADKSPRKQGAKRAVFGPGEIMTEPARLIEPLCKVSRLSRLILCVQYISMTP
jgi:hypothetical protein